MSNPQDPNSGVSRHNQQFNQASGHASIFANQGSGTQSFSNHNTFITNPRSWTGWAVLAFLVVDLAFLFYGAEAYTGRAGDSGDLWRAGIFLVLVVITLRLIRGWFRKRL